MKNSNYIRFRINKDDFAINVTNVREVIRMKETPIVKLVSSPEYISGMIKLRGEVIPVVNLRAKLKLAPKGIDKLSRIIVINMDGKPIGLLVDEVSKVQQVEEENTRQIIRILDLNDLLA